MRGYPTIKGTDGSPSIPPEYLRHLNRWAKRVRVAAQQQRKLKKGELNKVYESDDEESDDEKENENARNERRRRKRRRKRRPNIPNEQNDGDNDDKGPGGGPGGGPPPSADLPQLVLSTGRSI